MRENTLVVTRGSGGGGGEAEELVTESPFR